jgi:hypothetical protein
LLDCLNVTITAIRMDAKPPRHAAYDATPVERQAGAFRSSRKKTPCIGDISITRLPITYCNAIIKNMATMRNV